MRKVGESAETPASRRIRAYKSSMHPLLCCFAVCADEKTRNWARDILQASRRDETLVSALCDMQAYHKLEAIREPIAALAQTIENAAAGSETLASTRDSSNSGGSGGDRTAMVTGRLMSED